MTRKKWNKLKRQRPELFKGVQFIWKGATVGTDWSDVSKCHNLTMRSAREIIAVLTANRLQE